MRLLTSLGKKQSGKGENAFSSDAGPTRLFYTFAPSVIVIPTDVAKRQF
jgi:hypothetical protein